MTVSLIWAQDTSGCIGKDGGIPWHLPEDMKNFRRLTVGHTVLMGRATWDSLPPQFRPLPERRNLVLTRRPQWSAPGAERVTSIDQAYELVSGDLWVIGGGEVYAAAISSAHRLVITTIDTAVDGDVDAPSIHADWRAVSRDPEAGWAESASGLRYFIATYER
jgi:dihydrofolate reductase